MRGDLLRIHHKLVAVGIEVVFVNVLGSMCGTAMGASSCGKGWRNGRVYEF